MTPDLQISWLDGDGFSDMLPQMCHFGIPKKSEKQQVLDGPCGHLPSAGSCPPHSLLMKKGAPSSPGATGMNRPCYPHSRPRTPPPHRLLPIPYTLCLVTFSTTFLSSSSSLAQKCSSSTCVMQSLRYINCMFSY